MTFNVQHSILDDGTRLRTLGRAFARMLGTVFLLGTAGFVYAVGLGEMELKSAMNQRLDAEISVVGTERLEVIDILPSLASAEDFERLGTEITAVHLDLRFRMRERSEGNYIVHVTSGRPIMEPTLSFILKITWPWGQQLRKYTMELGPPATEPEPEPTPTLARTPTRASSTPARASRTSTRASNQRERSDRFVIARQGETLWRIALRVRPSSEVPMQEVIRALQYENPHAFINGDINRLMANAKLMVPDFGVEPQGELRLVATPIPGGVTVPDEPDPPASEGGLATQLELARQEIERLKQGNAEVLARVSALAEQVEKLTELVDRKDTQLAALQRELRRMRDGVTVPNNILLAGGLGLLLAFVVAIWLSRRSAAAAAARYATLETGVARDTSAQEAARTASASRSQPPAQRETPVQAEADDKASQASAPSASESQASARSRQPEMELPDEPEDDLDIDDEEQEIASKLDLARAYAEMGDADQAKQLLDEVIELGTDQEAADARELLRGLR